MKGRSITVEGVKYCYRVGKQTTVVRLLDDDSVFAKIHNHKLLRVAPGTFERGQWKRTSDGMVTPKDIESGIRAVLFIRANDPTYGFRP